VGTVAAVTADNRFEDLAFDRLDLRSLLDERAEQADPTRHPSAWFLGGGDSDLPEPPRAL
jgi:hypothetical protein